MAYITVTKEVKKDFETLLSKNEQYIKNYESSFDKENKTYTLKGNFTFHDGVILGKLIEKHK